MNFKLSMATALVAASIVSCSKNDSPPTAENPGNFIVTVSPAAATGVADYLLTASSLDTGKISTASNGVEQDGTYRYYVTHNDKFFSMLYGQGNPGAVTAYNIVDGKLNKLTNFQTETVQAFAPVNDDLLLFKISRNLASPTSTWYKVSTNSLTITGEGAVNTLDMTGIGELAHFTWIKQIGDKVFAPYQPIKDRSFNTDYPNKAFIAVFNYADMSLDKVIEDDRTSFIGKYFIDGLAVVENGDIYAYSPATATTEGVISTTKPSAITRIKAGTTTFDPGYYFDVETLSGKNINAWMYLGGNNFLVHSQLKAEKTAFGAGLHVGIVNVANKTYKAVTGLPQIADIVSVTTNNYTPKDGSTGYIGINLKDGTSAVYKIDAGSATAQKGLIVEGGIITAIQHLP